jgi:hypothetical protein
VRCGKLMPAHNAAAPEEFQKDAKALAIVWGLPVPVGRDAQSLVGRGYSIGPCYPAFELS